MGTMQKVAFDPKTDCYTVTVRPCEDKSLVLKATNEVAAFVSEHISEAGYWTGRMVDGTLVDVHLIQPI